MATTERMTAHKILIEMKLMEKRITKTVAEGVYCTTNKHSNNKIDGMTIEEYKAKMQGDYDKATAEIARYFAMRKALSLSNAVTKVTISGQEYTIAEAIAMKNHGVYYKQYLLDTMRSQYSAVQRTLTAKNGDELDRRAEKYVIDLYGNSEDVKKGEAATLARQQYREQHSYDLIDKIDIVERIAELEKEIDEFTAEVDATLSVSNALTEIEFTY